MSAGCGRPAAGFEFEVHASWTTHVHTRMKCCLVDKRRMVSHSAMATRAARGDPAAVREAQRLRTSVAAKRVGHSQQCWFNMANGPGSPGRLLRFVFRRCTAGSITHWVKSNGTIWRRHRRADSRGRAASERDTWGRGGFTGEKLYVDVGRRGRVQAGHDRINPALLRRADPEAPSIAATPQTGAPALPMSVG